MNTCIYMYIYMYIYLYVYIYIYIYMYISIYIGCRVYRCRTWSSAWRPCEGATPTPEIRDHTLHLRSN